MFFCVCAVGFGPLARLQQDLPMLCRGTANPGFVARVGFGRRSGIRPQSSSLAFDVVVFSNK